jgi:hypothetical protein
VLPGRRYLWAALLARIHEVFPLQCPHCGAEMAIIVFVTSLAQLSRVLAHIGEPARPPPVAPARVSVAWADEGLVVENIDHWAQPMPEYDFDQRASW